jgi:hypothetical protein
MGLEHSALSRDWPVSELVLVAHCELKRYVLAVVCGVVPSFG